MEIGQHARDAQDRGPAGRDPGAAQPFAWVHGVAEVLLLARDSSQVMQVGRALEKQQIDRLLGHLLLDGAQPRVVVWHGVHLASRLPLIDTDDTAGLLRWEVWRAKPSKKRSIKTETFRGPQAPAPPPGEFASSITDSCIKN